MYKAVLHRALSEKLAYKEQYVHSCVT